MNKKSFIKTQSNVLDEHLTSISVSVEMLKNRQDHLYEINSMLMSAVTAMRNILTKNGIISLEEFDDTTADLINKAENFTNTDANNVLNNIRGEDMLQA